jgi:hypothetical protein
MTVLGEAMLNELTPLFNEFDVPKELYNADWTNEMESGDPKVLGFAIAVLVKAGYEPMHAEWIVNGIPEKQFICDFDVSKGQRHTYHNSLVQLVVEAYINRRCNNTTFEVGFDYSIFDGGAVMNKYGLTYYGKVESWYSRQRRKSEPNYEPLTYNVWTDGNGNFFSTSAENLGGGYYHGFVFTDINTALNFVMDIIGDEDNYVKEVTLLDNGFGGATQNDLDADAAEREFAQNMGG